MQKGGGQITAELGSIGDVAGDGEDDVVRVIEVLVEVDDVLARDGVERRVLGVTGKP